MRARIANPAGNRKLGQIGRRCEARTMTKTLPILAVATSLFAFTACGGDQTAPTQPATQQSAQQPAAKQPAAQEPAQKPAVPALKKPKLPPKIDMTLVTAYFGNEPTAPKAEVASTPDMVALGKALYHDASLSKNGNVSCASCHDLNNYGQDGKATSPGSEGKNGDRNAPTTLNAFRNAAQFWDGRAESVEDQAILQVLSPAEHGLADELTCYRDRRGAELRALIVRADNGADA
jgi:cytochrome c peroxidase